MMNGQSLLCFLILLHWFPVAGAQNEGRNISPAQADSLIRSHPDTASLVILDVRLPAEYASGHLEGARNLNLYSSHFRTGIATLERNKTFLVYCHSGPRGVSAMKKMKKLGFREVYNISGGIRAWKRIGLPVVVPASFQSR